MKRRRSPLKVTPRRGLLFGARVYLSGPMDFVASRKEEMERGWRTRVSAFLARMGAIVFDPWFKPGVLGFYRYGVEKPESQEEIKKLWDFSPRRAGPKARAECAHRFWQTVHIDLRMVDTSDFTIAYCPTNIYSVGTVHEVVTARLQHKPVLFVSPPFDFESLKKLRDHLSGDPRGSKLLADLESEVPIKQNPRGIPSLWYMPILGGHSFFDGFGFQAFAKAFKWKRGPIEAREEKFPPKRPLLPYLRELNQRIPTKYDLRSNRRVMDDDWLLWDLRKSRS